MFIEKGIVVTRDCNILNDQILNIETMSILNF